MPHPLSTIDYHNLLETIEIAYSIPDRIAMLKAVFEKIEQWIGIQSAAFYPLDQRTHHFLVDGAIGYHASLETIRLFHSRFIPLHPIAARGLHLKTVNQPIRITDCVAASRLPDTEYGRDFQHRVAIIYELCMTLACQGDVLACLGLHRNRRERDFSPREITLIELFLPHLARALHNIILTETIVSGLDIGLIIVGREGKALFINDAAKRILQGRPVSMILDPGIGPNPSFFNTTTGIYRVLTRSVFQGETKAIFLDPLPPRDHIHTQLTGFDLTARQEEIAMLVIQGYANREIAERLFIAEQTVKDHLRDVFEKMDICHRSELTAKALGLGSHRRTRTPLVV